MTTAPDVLVARPKGKDATAKALIYQHPEARDITDAVARKGKATRPAQCKAEVPYATFDDSELQKYPEKFVLKRVNKSIGVKVGSEKDFDSTVYSRIIQANQQNKVNMRARAWGSGNILAHQEKTTSSSNEDVGYVCPSQDDDAGPAQD